jgi:hypothetical protein
MSTVTSAATASNEDDFAWVRRHNEAHRVAKERPRALATAVVARAEWRAAYRAERLARRAPAPLAAAG